MKILFASHNKEKLEEVKNILNEYEVISLNDLDDKDEIEENGNSLEENAFLKANHFYQKYHLPVISDDTGLFVKALNGKPGIHSARYSGNNATYKSNNQKLLHELEGIADREAYFETVICYIDGEIKYFYGRANGEITLKVLTDNAFGYDSVFYVPSLKKTYAEMSKDEKNKISHRYKALDAFSTYLKESLLEKKVLAYAEEILNKDCEIVERLLGGMSNYTYVIKCDNELYTLRIPGEFAEAFVDRIKEEQNVKLMEQFNISNKTLYLNVNNGVKLGKYLKGTILSTLNDYPYEKVSDLLKMIHNSSKLSLYDYEPFTRLSTYENYLKEIDFVFPNEYLELRNEFNTYYDYLNNQEKVLCHGDSQPSNFIIGDDEKLYIVDFEYTANIDPIYDIACFANIRLEEGLKLLKTYYQEVDDDKYLRFYLWRAFQCFQWYNVAYFKDIKGLSQKLKIDFKMVAESYLNNIKVLMEEVNKYKNAKK